jgi:hypothetical protein
MTCLVEVIGFRNGVLNSALLGYLCFELEFTSATPHGGCERCVRVMQMDVSRILIGLGLIIILVGLVWPSLSKLGLGRLPGDIMVERQNFTFYFPLMTSIVVSILLSLVFWFLSR